MMVTMERVRNMIKSMNRGIRIMKSAAARLRRRSTKKVVNQRLINKYSKLRRLRKKNVHN
jgi:hypothetical protein